MFRTVTLFILLGFSPTLLAQASVSKPVKVDAIRTTLGLNSSYSSAVAIQNIKIAILDAGFAGVDTRPYLPANRILVEHYDAEWVKKHNLGDVAFSKPFTPNDPHGRLMAQLVWAVTGSLPDGPQFYLLNANGPTMFRRAVKYAVEAKVDVILFASTFEGAGNYDGKGPINAVVDEAVNAGITWVNAAGNTGQMVYDSTMSLTGQGWLNLQAGTTIKLVNRLDEQSTTITLTWNDYQNTEDAGTLKDLDLFVEDAQGKVIAKSELRQVIPGVVAGEGQTTNPRERLTLTDLSQGEYRIRVKYISGPIKSTDRIRVLVTPGRNATINDSITNKPVPVMELVGALGIREIYPPADHAGVLTVGDFSKASSMGPTADGRVKPDVVLSSSLAKFSNGEESEGSSNAAAFFAGVVVTLKAAEPTLTTPQLKKWVKQLDAAPVSNTVLAGATPNQTKALKLAINTVEMQKAQGVEDPGVWVSSPGGSYRVRPGGVIESTGGKVVATAPTTIGIHAPWRTPTPSELKNLIRNAGK